LFQFSDSAPYELVAQLRESFPSHDILRVHLADAVLYELVVLPELASWSFNFMVTYSNTLRRCNFHSVLYKPGCEAEIKLQVLRLLCRRFPPLSGDLDTRCLIEQMSVSVSVPAPILDDSEKGVDNGKGDSVNQVFAILYSLWRGDPWRSQYSVQTGTSLHFEYL
jgi:hypothetical protein